MVDNEIQINIYECISASLIAAYKKYICYSISNKHIETSKDLIFNVFSDGSFFFRDEFGYANSQSIGKDLQNSNDVEAAIKTSLAVFNKKISELNIKDERFKTAFFPLDYMRSISKEKTKPDGNIPVYWSCTYDFEVPAYNLILKNSKGITSKEQIRSKIANIGMQIDINTRGRIIGMQYNLLPFSPKHLVTLYDILINENEEVPEISYFMDTSASKITPFFIDKNNKRKFPACKESIVPSVYFIDPINNPTVFNPERVVMWLSSNELSSNNTYANNNQKNKIPHGTKVIRLKPESSDSEKTPILYWWQNDYHIEQTLERNLSTNNNIITDDAGKVFRNDILHLLVRVADYKGIQNEFDNVINKITKFSEKELNSKQIEKAQDDLSKKLHINLNDKPETIKRLSESLFKVYDPITPNGKFSDEVLIVPLSYDWFKSDKKLLEHYNTVWGNSLSALNDHFNANGFSGDVIYIDRIDEIKNELLLLKDFIIQTTANNTPEAKWLNQLTVNSFSSIKCAIFLTDNAWKIMSNKRYADSVAIENSFGSFKIPALLSIIIHELRMTWSNFLFFAKGTVPVSLDSADSHIDISYTEYQWNKASYGNFKEISKNPDFIDQLYQSHRAYGLISLGIIINIISES